jgi:hypothetical protein
LPVPSDDRDPIYLWDLAPLIGRDGKLVCCFVMLYGLDGDEIRWELYDYLRRGEGENKNSMMEGAEKCVDGMDQSSSEFNIEHEVNLGSAKSNNNNNNNYANSDFTLEAAAEATTLVPAPYDEENLEGRSVRGLHFQEIIARRERIQRAQFLLNCRDLPIFYIPDTVPNDGTSIGFVL